VGKGVCELLRMPVRDLLQFLLRGLMKREAIKPGYLQSLEKLHAFIVYRQSDLRITVGSCQKVSLNILGSLPKYY